MLGTRQIVAPLSEEVNHIQDLPQPVVAYGRNLVAGEVLPFHSHRRAQFVYASRGVMTVTTSSGSYVVPPQRAVWMPGGVEHRIDARSDVAMRTLYVEITEAAHLPMDVCVLQVSPLLRELVVAAVLAGPEYPPDSPESRIMAVILDQIRVQPVAALALPMPAEARVLRVVQALRADPADSRDLGAWAKEVGAIKRTLTRLFSAQTGMSFRSWREQLRVLRALELLATGESVTNVALEVGYENTSAFIEMFRRCLGTTPGRYLKIANR